MRFAVVMFDPFTAPAATHKLADACARDRVVVTGEVLYVEPVAWAGGPVLEVTLGDPTGTLTLAFFGRHQIGGIILGNHLTAAGTITPHHGTCTLLNPTLWLTPTPALT